MKINNEIFYHFHNNLCFNDVWIPGNELLINDEFNSNLGKIIKGYSTSININNEQRINFCDIVDEYLNRDVSKEKLIEILEISRSLIYYSNLFMQEKALEEVRKEKYPNLPSRLHSIWLTDECNIDFWHRRLKSEVKKLDLYKVMVSGKVFKSSESYLPSKNDSYEDMLKKSEKYWNPNLEMKEEQEAIEYLFQGKVKILEKIM